MDTNAEQREPERSQLMPIGRVVELVQHAHPSVTQSSLRFLEREGLLVPTRTPGGHRLYSDADVERIVQIKEWQAQRLTLDEIQKRLRQRDTLPDPATLTRTFLDQVLGGEIETAGRTILAADDLGLPLHQLFGEVIQPALVEVGEGWQHGTILVAQEKTISELVRDLVAELSLRHTAHEMDGPTVVAACVKGERHELGLRMIIGLLRADGIRVQYLGADVDTGFLLDAVRLHPPAAIMLSARFDASLPVLETAIPALLAAASGEPAPAIVVGGRLATEQAGRLEALGAVPITSDSVTAAARTLTSIISAAGDPADTA